MSQPRLLNSKLMHPNPTERCVHTTPCFCRQGGGTGWHPLLVLPFRDPLVQIGLEAGFLGSGKRVQLLTLRNKGVNSNTPTCGEKR
ncbi:hypothetical protein JZ751_010944 [Albula glossodonta]|uniref:Uncharacterized protein n=1 Tax=Albula glossodonta TaxID=121402 RepID=A0A8T2NVA6_9TELE|nr:hypothetical protein JZ751_010944 [Albula glossodonta]